jgi:hypothetical protein
VKHFRFLLPLLLFALLLSGCAGEPQPYEYTSGEYTVTVDPINQTITGNGQVYTYTVERTQVADWYEITFPDGSSYWWSDSGYVGAGGWSDDYREDKYLPGDFLVDALKQSAPREKQGSVGIGFLLMGLGALDFFLPEFPFYSKYGWRFKNAEPSEAYLTFTRISGAIVAIAGLVYCII